MSDTCGYTGTDSGEPCQNPAGEDGYCWIDGHTGPGRPSKFTNERAADAIEAAREGVSKAGCARIAGVDKATLERWLDAHEEFRNDFARARGNGELTLIRDGLRDPDTDSQMARFLLATSFGHVKAEKREHVGEGGGPMTVTLRREVVDGGD